MKNKIWEKTIIWVLPCLVAFTLVTLPQTAFAVETEELPPGQTVAAEEPDMPVGGWAPVQMEYIPEDVVIAGEDDEIKSNHNVINGNRNSVFTKGASSVGYNALTTQAQKNYYKALDETATEFMNAESDLEPTVISSDYKCYIIGAANYYNLGISDVDEAMQVFYAYDYDHPAYYWLSNTVMFNSSALYPCTEEEYASVRTRQTINTLVSSGIERYVNLAENGTDTLDKIAIIHNKIVNDIDYAYQSDGVTPETAKWAHSVQGVFDSKHKHVVCEGYADTFSLAMNYMGIPNYYIVGTAGSSGPGGGGGHAWNAVSADGGNTFLYMDLTWDDFGEGGYAYTYFGMPASDFEDTHFKYEPTGTDNEWLYSITGDFNDSFEGTYYNQGGFYYDSSIDDVTDFTFAGVAKAKRAGEYVSFMSSNTSDLSTVAYALGVGLRYYTVSYKDTNYYYMITQVGEHHMHSWDEPAYEWVEDNSMVTATRTCGGCGEIEIESVDTTYTVKTEPTCGSAGVGLYTAAFESEAFETQTKESAISATGSHTWNDGKVTKQPTCKAEGVKTFTCTVCGATETADMPKVNHDYKEVEGTAKAPTYTETGKEADQKCSRCGDVKTGAELPVLTPETVAVKLSTVKYVYDGKAKKPGVTVIVDGEVWNKDNYSMTYASGRKTVGKYKVTVTLNTAHTESAMATFTIVPKQPVIASATAGKKKMTVKMKTAVGKTGGKTYQIGYKVKGTKTWKYKTTTKQSLVIKSLKKGKQYQVKVRAYKTVSKVKYYGAWSKVKTTKKVK